MIDFSAQLSNWKRLLATVPLEVRGKTFKDASFDLARSVAVGSVDRATAAGQLTEIGLAHSFEPDWTQETITQAFEHIPELAALEQKQAKRPNGKSPLLFLSKADFLAGFVPPDYLVDGMLQRRFVYALTGQTGHAKTAIALLLAEQVSRADYATLGNHRVEKGRVIYFVGENADDVRQRVIGADSKRDDDVLADTITYIPGVFNINQMFATISLHAQEIGGVDLVIVDTSAAYFLTDDEMSNTQMGNHARMLRRLTELPGGPCVLVLCHPIKHAVDPTQLLPRGGGAFLAEVDGNLTAWKHDDNIIELHHNKLRGPGFEPMTFKTEMIKTDKLVDKKGRQMPTVRAVAISRSEEENQEAKTAEEEDRVLVALLADPAVSFAGIAERWNWKNDKGEPLKARVQRIVMRLEKSKPAQIKKNRNRWELTESGKENARSAALLFERQREAVENQQKMF